MKYLQGLLSVLFLLAVLVIVESANDILSSLQMQGMRYPRPVVLMRRTDSGDTDALLALQMEEMNYPGPALMPTRLDSGVKYCTYNVHCDGWKPDAMNECVCVHPQANSIIGHCECGEQNQHNLRRRLN